MKGCSFTIDLTGTPTDFAETARTAIIGAGGQFDGDEEGGTFRLTTGIGKLEGSYRVSESILIVTLSNKPVLISCGRIEKQIRKYLGR